MTLIALVAVLILLLLIAGITPRHTVLSQFELERRKKIGNSEAVESLRREQLLGNIVSLQRVVVSLLLVTFVLLSVVAWGWLIGIFVSVIVALEYNAIARLTIVNQQSQKLYLRYETPLLAFIEKYPGFFKIIQAALPPEKRNSRLDSREELEYVVSQATHVLNKEERHRIISGLHFEERPVKEIMTPRGMIDNVSKKELLGPLVLDDLHKTGHSRFPVIDGDIDHIVGMLYIQNLLVINSGKGSTSVEKTMEPRVFYIHEDQSLAHALAAFIRTRHHLFIVINEFRETVGVISLEDVMEAFLGHKIVDEFDAHEDLRVVAARNPRGNNHPKKREDV
jgi:CBS domain containing-hemolysin-like protein